MIARACDVPRDALLARYTAQDGAYTDCFEVMHPGQATMEEFIVAFYTTWLFRLERFILMIALRKRIRDTDAVALACGETDTFAAWTVEDRAGNQLLLCDLGATTRSYFAIAPKDGGVTRLVFGSAVTPKGREMPGWVRAITPLHRLYSKALLRLAEHKLRRG